MENASDALRMAAAMLLFVGALSITIMAFSKARQASATVMETSDKTKTYYSIENPTSEREVGVDTVIYNLYSYYQNQNTILFYRGYWNNANNSVSITGKMVLYYTEASDRKDATGQSILDKSTLTVSQGNRGIYGLDINDELIRQEPWRQNETSVKQFIDALVQKKYSPEYSWSKTKIASSNLLANTKLQIGFVYDMPALTNNPRGRFIERVGEYNYEAIYDSQDTYEYDGYTIGQQFSEANQKKSTITFEENGETIENSEGNKKRVIEYIYIGN